MSEVRLDAETARALLRKVSKVRTETFAHCGKDMDDAFLHGLEIAFGAIGVMVAGLEVEAEKRPPALSDWVRVCEPPPATHSTLMGPIAFLRREAIVVLDEDLRREPVIQARVIAQGVSTQCATTTDLRAALEALAKEAAP